MTKLNRDIVITGIGVASPIGIGKDRFWASLIEGRSGVCNAPLFVESKVEPPLGAPIADFDPKKYVRPRKSLKVMSRDIQLGFTAADLAWTDAGFAQTPPNPERAGIALGADMIACELPELVPVYQRCTVDGQFDSTQWGRHAMADLFPLWMLKYLPNMPACHVGITLDVRGPTNAIVHGETSSLAAFSESVRALERGHVDVMIAGGASSRMHPLIWSHERLRQYTQWTGEPAAALRPFDARRDGMVNGEGSGAVILETREHAQGRGAAILCRVLGFGMAYEHAMHGRKPTGDSIKRAIRAALDSAGIKPGDVGHVNANGLSTEYDDRIEAQAIAETLGDVPVFAPKSYFGNLGAGSGAVELVASVLALVHGQIPKTLNYEQPDPACPVNVIRGEARPVDKPIALALNFAPSGQAVAVVIGKA